MEESENGASHRETDSLEDKLGALIRDRVSKLRSHAGRNQLRRDVLYPAREKMKDKDRISECVEKLEIVQVEVRSRIRDLKKQIPDITDETPLVATYLLFGKVLRTWDAVLLLMREGFSYEVMELIRSIEENLDLIKTFQLDKKGKHLQAWFGGKIIKHQTSRQLQDNWLKREDGPASVREHDLSTYAIQSYIYSALSHYPHAGFTAVLDLIDVFTEDFDWNGYAQAHHSAKNAAGFIRGTMIDTLITLKHTCLFLGDMPGYEAADELLIEFNGGPLNEKSLRDLLEEIRLA